MNTRLRHNTKQRVPSRIWTIQNTLKLSWYSALCISLWTILLVPRGLGVHSISESLWTEDSLIFLNQAYSEGIRSIIISYQGYLHVFQRLFTLLVIPFPLFVAPYFLFAGSCLALSLLALIIQRRLLCQGLKNSWIFIAIAMVLLQPHSGEVYFSITNTQWILGLTLAIYLCLPEVDSRNAIELGLLAVISMTGPFSLLLLPILCLQLLLRKDWLVRRKTYLIVTTGAIIQLSVLMHSSRLKAQASITNSPSDWLSASLKYLTFGGGNTVTAAAIIFWVVLIFGIARHVLPRFLDKDHKQDSPYLFLASSLIFGVSLYSVSLWSNVTSIGPVNGGGARYFFVPYGLLFVGGLVALKNSVVLRGVLAVMVALICAISFHPGRRENMQWPAFARFATSHPGIEPPINPQWPFAPQWKVVPRPSVATDTTPSFPVMFRSSSQDTPNLKFNIEGACASNKFVGLEIDASHGSPGLVTLQWGSADTINMKNILQRFYPSGLVKMQFAIERDLDESYFMLTLNTSSEPSTITNIKVYCL